MKMKLLVLIAILFMGAASARAEITFGLAISNPLIGSEDQARRFDAYLEKHLNEQVRVRVLGSEKDLQQWIQLYRQVDFGVFSSTYLQSQPASSFFPLANIYRNSTAPAGALVAGMGVGADRVEKLRSLLAGMSEDAEGRQLLGDFGVSRLATPATGLPTVSPKAARRISPSAGRTAPRPSAPAPRRATRSAAPATGRPKVVTPQVTLGFVHNTGPLASEARARRLTGYLGAKLGEPVAVKVFSSEKMLYDWVSLYREVDLAVLGADFVRRQAVGKLYPLVDIESAEQGKSGYQIVAGPRNKAGFLQKTQKALLGINRDAAGAALLRELGIVKLSVPLAQPPAPVARTSRVVKTPVAPIRPRGTQPRPQVRPTSPKLAAPPLPVAARSPLAPAPAPVAPPAQLVRPVAVVPEAALPAQALAAEMDGRWEDAMLVYEQLLQTDPRRVDLWRRIADIQAMLGRPHQATLALLCAIGQIPQELPLYAQLAQAHSVNGQLQAALFALRRGLDLEPQNTDFLRTQGQLAFWSGDLDLARESYFRILSGSWRAARN